MPLERRVTLKFQHRDGFVNEYAANVSLKGMFITAWVPEPEGSVFLFEVQVADRQRLIHGIGEVVWAREMEESPDRPSGMGIRFLKLDDASREVINGMVETHARQDGSRLHPSERPDGTIEVEELFGAEAQPTSQTPPPATDGASGVDEAETEAGRAHGRAMARREGRGLLAFWATLVALLGGAALWLLLS